MLKNRDYRLLANTPPERLACVKTVQLAYDSILGTYRYCTDPISTGKCMYDVFLQYKVRTVEELKKKSPTAYKNEILLPNIAAGIEHADRVQKRTRQTVVAPVRFEALFADPKQRLTQDEYMAIWYPVLGPQAHAHDLPNDWALSTGGLKEATRSIEIRHGLLDDPIPENANLDEQLRLWIQRANIHDRKICDEDGYDLEFHNLLRQAVDNVTWLHHYGFDASAHAQLLEPWRDIFLKAEMDPRRDRSEYVWHNGKRINFWDARLSFNLLADTGLMQPVPSEPKLAANLEAWYRAMGGPKALAADFAHEHRRA